MKMETISVYKIEPNIRFYISDHLFSYYKIQKSIAFIRLLNTCFIKYYWNKYSFTSVKEMMLVINLRTLTFFFYLCNSIYVLLAWGTLR